MKNPLSKIWDKTVLGGLLQKRGRCVILYGRKGRCEMKERKWKKFVDEVCKRTELTHGQRTAILAKRLYVEEGVPFEISQEYARKCGYVIDEGYFEGLLEEERELSRKGSRFKREIF